MPTYNVTDPNTGRNVKLTGDSPPTEAELNDIFSTMGESPAAVAKTSEMAPVGTQKAGITDIPATDAADMSVAQKFLAGAGGGLYMTGKGIQQKVAQVGEKLGIVSPETVKGITSEGEAAREDLERLKSQSTAASAGEFIGETLPSMLMPGGVGGKAITRIGTAALAGAGQGALKFTGEDESMAQNVLTGAAGGAAGAGVASVAGKVINAATGKVAQAEAEKLGEKFGIRTTLGEEIKNPHIQRAETWMERIPVIGIKGFREAQYADTQQAAKGFLSKYVRNPDEVTGALTENRNYVSGLYEGLKDKVKDFADLKAYALDTSKVTKNLLDRYPDTFKQFPDKKVADIAAKFQAKAGDVHSFDDLWEFRKGIGDILGQAKKKLQSGEVNETQYGMLSSIYSSISKDIDKFTDQIGRKDIKVDLKSANEAYKNYVVKYNVLERAMDKSTNSEGFFSPKRFSNELDKIVKKEKYHGVFSAPEKDEMSGLANILSVAKRAGQYAENPPTGARLAEPGIIMHAVGLAKTVPYAVVARFLSTTQTGKSLAKAASKVEAKSPLMQKIVDDSYKLAARYATTESLRSSRRSKQNKEE